VIPIIPSSKSVTSKIANYLNGLLEPFVQDKIRPTIFLNETDFARKLIDYTYIDHPLSPSTLFATIKILNLYSMVSHKTMSETLYYFLFDNLAVPKLEDLSIGAIHNLLQLFLYNNIFHYNGKIYSCTKGSPSTIPLTETLASVYLFEWQKKITRDERMIKELYGRYDILLFVN